MKLNLALNTEYAKTKTRREAAKVFAKSGVVVSGPARLHVVEVLQAKREWYALEHRAVSDKRERAKLRKRDESKAAKAKARTMGLVKKYGWASLAEVKTAARALGLMDARLSK